jgi:hypothetical protein
VDVLTRGCDTASSRSTVRWLATTIGCVLNHEARPDAGSNRYTRCPSCTCTRALGTVKRPHRQCYWLYGGVQTYAALHWASHAPANVPIVHPRPFYAPRDNGGRAEEHLNCYVYQRATCRDRDSVTRFFRSLEQVDDLMLKRDAPVRPSFPEAAPRRRVRPRAATRALSPVSLTPTPVVEAASASAAAAATTAVAEIQSEASSRSSRSSSRSSPSEVTAEPGHAPPPPQSIPMGTGTRTPPIAQPAVEPVGTPTVAPAVIAQPQMPPAPPAPPQAPSAQAPMPRLPRPMGVRAAPGVPVVARLAAPMSSTPAATAVLPAPPAVSGTAPAPSLLPTPPDAPAVSAAPAPLPPPPTASVEFSAPAVAASTEVPKASSILPPIPPEAVRPWASAQPPRAGTPLGPATKKARRGRRGGSREPPSREAASSSTAATPEPSGKGRGRSGAPRGTVGASVPASTSAGSHPERSRSPASLGWGASAAPAASTVGRAASSSGGTAGPATTRPAGPAPSMWKGKPAGKREQVKLTPTQLAERQNRPLDALPPLPFLVAGFLVCSNDLLMFAA